MKRFVFLGMSVFFSSLSAYGGSGMGNTLFAIRCSQTPNEQPPAGLYVADYLMTMGTSFHSTNSFRTVQDNFISIFMILNLESPALAKSFQKFTKLFLNTDESQPYVWEKPSFRLARDKKIFNLNGDSDLSVEEKYAYEDLPAHCKNQDKPSVEIVFIKESPRASGRPKDKPLFKYDENLLKELEETGPLQISMAVVHEWLWFHAENIRSVWRINRFLHSEKARQMARNGESILNVMSMMGFQEQLSEPVQPVKDSVPSDHRSENSTQNSSFNREIFDSASLCSSEDFYSNDDLNLMIERNPSYMGAEIPLSRNFELNARMKTCDLSSGDCTSWVGANPQYFIHGLNGDTTEVKGEPLYFSYKLLGTTFWTTSIRLGGVELICEQQNGLSLGESSEIVCGHRADSFLTFGPGSQSKVILSGTLSKDCLHLRSTEYQVDETGIGKVRVMQVGVFEKFPAPMRRVQAVDILIK